MSPATRNPDCADEFESSSEYTQKSECKDLRSRGDNLEGVEHKTEETHAVIGTNHRG